MQFFGSSARTHRHRWPKFGCIVISLLSSWYKHNFPFFTKQTFKIITKLKDDAYSPQGFIFKRQWPDEVDYVSLNSQVYVATKYKNRGFQNNLSVFEILLINIKKSSLQSVGNFTLWWNHKLCIQFLSQMQTVWNWCF